MQLCLCMYLFKKSFHSLNFTPFNCRRTICMVSKNWPIFFFSLFIALPFPFFFHFFESKKSECFQLEMCTVFFHLLPGDHFLSFQSWSYTNICHEIDHTHTNTLNIKGIVLYLTIFKLIDRVFFTSFQNKFAKLAKYKFSSLYHLLINDFRLQLNNCQTNLILNNLEMVWYHWCIPLLLSSIIYMTIFLNNDCYNNNN